MTTAAALRIVFTGARGTLDGLGGALATVGLACEEIALLDFGPPRSWRALDEAIAQLGRYAAVAVTSPRAARSLIERMSSLGADRTAVPPIWCGAASADLLRGHFARVEVPSAEVAAPASLAVRLAGSMLAAGVGSPVLFPCGEVRREELLVRLRAAGRRVDPVIAYRASLAPLTDVVAAIDRADVLIVTSPRVAQLAAAATSHGARPPMVTIGPTTAETASMAGWTPDAVAMRPTVADVVGAIHALLPSLT